MNLSPSKLPQPNGIGRSRGGLAESRSRRASPYIFQDLWPEEARQEGSEATPTRKNFGKWTVTKNFLFKDGTFRDACHCPLPKISSVGMQRSFLLIAAHNILFLPDTHQYISYLL